MVRGRGKNKRGEKGLKEADEEGRAEERIKDKGRRKTFEMLKKKSKGIKRKGN